MTRVPESEGAEESIAQAAAEWVGRRDRGFTEEEARAFAAWRSADPRHATEFERIDGAWSKLAGAGEAGRVAHAADAVLAAALARKRQRRVTAWSAGLLAAAAALAVVAYWRAPTAVTEEPPAMVAAAATNDYQVLTSTARRVPLPDGSVAELNGDSAIETEFTATARRVRLVRGEAHFSVSKDPDRPFFVVAGPIVVRAVGTAFNVRLAEANVEVLVTEGTVRLEETKREAAEAQASTAESSSSPSPSLVAGQRAVVEIAASSEAQPVVAIDAPEPEAIDNALSWQSTRLAFQRTPLPDVVGAFNRYNPRQLVLGDPVLRGRTLSGTFRADNLDGFVRLLSVSLELSAEDRGDRIVLRPMHESSQKK